jgi:hypothetical protein
MSFPWGTNTDISKTSTDTFGATGLGGNSFTPDDGPDLKTGAFNRWNLPLSENFQRPSILEGIWKIFNGMCSF